MNIKETIAAKQREMIPSRLVNGAAILGRLWREGNRCISEWTGLCPCDQKKDFCIVKRKWLDLVLEFNGGKYPYNLSGNEGFLTLECMDQAAFDATELTILKTVPGARAPIRVGRNGTCLQTILDLADLEGKPGYSEAVEAVVRIQEVGL